MGNTLPKRKDAPGSLAAEEREKERGITEDNQLIVYKVAYTEAMHSGSLIANHHGKFLIPNHGGLFVMSTRWQDEEAE